MNIALIFLAPIFYFYMSWFFPWELIQFKSSISITYIFDIFFFIVVYALYKQKNIIGKLSPKKITLQLGITITFAIVFVLIAKASKLNAPFKYVDHLFLQILILAPLIEELVFRGAFFEIFQRSKINRQVVIYSNSLLFSISHLPAIWHLPKEFHSYIIFQLFYTLVLGWICAQSRLRSGGLVLPIILHFSFNLVFYIAVTEFSL